MSPTRRNGQTKTFTVNPECSSSLTTEVKRFYIFGYQISHSLSPALHNAGFKHIGFQGHYSLHESPEVDDDVQAIMSQPSFFGASVTFPHKLQIGELLDGVTEAAQTVGAVNTVVVRHEPSGDGRQRCLIGDNTDWSGIRTCISTAWEDDFAKAPGLVWGAGGAARAACHALRTLNLTEIFIVNRTKSRAQEMAQHFPMVQIHVYETLPEATDAAAAKGTPIRIVVGCVPADGKEEDQIPSNLFLRAATGVLVEMAYRPPVTGLMKAAMRNAGWTIRNGPDVLREQAYAQFELWTGQDAPKQVMYAAMEKEIEDRNKK
ncbi:hypothetical protein AB5N19_03412 [Seiridium cardinale]